MRRLMISVFASLAMLATVVPAVADPAETAQLPLIINFPDTENRKVIFMNTTREDVCTDDQVAAEEAYIDWLVNEVIPWSEYLTFIEEGGTDDEWIDEFGEIPPEPGPEPEFPEEAEGLVPLQTVLKQTRNGAVVSAIQGKKLHVEVWELDEETFVIGPCTDTASERLYASGTGSVNANDNDLLGFEGHTRANAWGHMIHAALTDVDGNTVRFKSRFHFNTGCLNSALALRLERVPCFLYHSQFR